MSCFSLSSQLYIDAAWQHGLSVLGATPAQVEHGLELHRSLAVAEHYGFLPMLWSDRACAEMNTMASDGRGIVDYGRRSDFLRTVAPTHDSASEAEFFSVLERAGVDAMVIPVNDYGETLEDALKRIAAYRHLCLSFPQRLVQVTSAAGIDAAQKSGKMALLFSLTGMPVFGAGDMTDPAALLEWVEIWHAMGVRFMHVGYNRRNLFADGCTESSDGGLSDLGRELIAVMNRLGIIVDLPHSSHQTTLDAAHLSNSPVVASHIGCHAIFAGPRCKRDDELKAIASTGGYIGILAIPALLGPDADLRQMLRHVEHALKVVGSEHVVLGSDLPYTHPRPQELVEPSGSWRRQSAGGWKPGQLAGGGEDHFGGSLTWSNRALYTVGLVTLGLSDEAISQMHVGNLKRVLNTPKPG